MNQSPLRRVNLKSLSPLVPAGRQSGRPGSAQSSPVLSRRPPARATTIHEYLNPESSRLFCFFSVHACGCRAPFSAPAGPARAPTGPGVGSPGSRSPPPVACSDRPGGSGGIKHTKFTFRPRLNSVCRKVLQLGNCFEKLHKVKSLQPTVWSSISTLAWK